MDRKLTVVIGLSAMLCSCAEIPEGTTVRYYYPKAEIKVVGRQTVACSLDKPNGGGTGLPSETQTVNAHLEKRYFADVANQRSLDFRSFSSWLNDVDMDITLTDDGRLAGVNVTETGKAEATASGAASFAKALKGLVAPTLATSPGCPHLFDHGVKEVSVDYQTGLTFPLTADDIANFKPDQQGNLIFEKALKPFVDTNRPSALLVSELQPVMAKFTLQYPYEPSHLFGKIVSNGGSQGDKSACDSPETKTPQYVCLRNTTDLEVEVIAYSNTGLDGDRPIVPPTHYRVPLTSTTLVPIAPPAALGKSTIKLALDDAGGIKEIGYSKTSSLLEVFGAAAAVATIAATR